MTDTQARPHRADLRFPYPDASLASTVEAAVRLDAGDIDGDRSAASVERDGAVLTVVLEADDPAALRAAKRTWCGLVDAAERTALLPD